MSGHLPSWDDLRIFLHVSRGGSLTAAAHSLALSHATAYRRVQKLEQELGVRLFERTRAGYALTKAGEELAGVAADMERSLLLTTRSLSQREAWPGGVVKITSVDTLMHHVLPPSWPNTSAARTCSCSSIPRSACSTSSRARRMWRYEPAANHRSPWSGGAYAGLKPLSTSPPNGRS